MIPAWKLRREALRLWYQIVDLPRNILSLPERMMHRRKIAAHDRNFAELIKTHPGRIEPAGKYAIFLVYQPKGIPPSVYHTLDYLVGKGYAPVVVMNSSLQPQDRARLPDHCWKVMTRPNFGYDFGGYRDAIRFLRESAIAPDRLIIMNDSVWFPMQGDPVQRFEDVLDRKNLDVYGLNQDQKVRRQKTGQVFYEQRHLESYFYLFSGKCVASAPFQKFWRDYRMSSDKRYTIKHGEIGFSKYLLQNGVKMEGELYRSRFVEAIETCDADFLRITLEYAAYADAKYLEEREALLAGFQVDDEWRNRVLFHIREVALRRPFNTSFPYASDRLFGTSYLKKNSQTYFHDMRMQFLRAIDNGVIAAPAPDILAELRDLIAAHDPATAERTL